MTITTRTTCRICDHALELVLDYGQMPLAGGFVPPGDPRINLRYPLRLAWCPECTLMQLLDTVPASEIFTQYTYRSSAAPALISHFQELATDLVRRGYIDNGPVVEIGCNDGVFLRALQELSKCQLLGIDPSDVAREAAAAAGYPLLNTYCTPETAREAVERYGKAEVVLAANVLAHTDDLHSLVGGIRELLANYGTAILEVQYQGDLLERTQFDTVYHEHTCYYSLTALHTLLHAHGLSIVNVVPIPTHSGSIRIFARFTRHSKPVAFFAERIGVNEDVADSPNAVQRFAFRAERARWVIRETIQAISQQHQVAAYGAAGRATILLNWCELGKHITQVFDASPLRQGRIVPGTNTFIVPTSELRNSTNYCLITAWNYANDIPRQHPEYTGMWITPLPEVRIR